MLHLSFLNITFKDWIAENRRERSADADITIKVPDDSRTRFMRLRKIGLSPKDRIKSKKIEKPERTSLI
jgi:hypothetical protein